MNKNVIIIMLFLAIFSFTACTISSSSTYNYSHQESNNKNNNNSIHKDNTKSNVIPGMGPKKENNIELNCHPSYSGCLKADASDYDCIGGSGNGPYYTGKVQVIGPDVFGLDRDGDGWGCE